MLELKFYIFLFVINFFGCINTLWRYVISSNVKRLPKMLTVTSSTSAVGMGIVSSRSVRSSALALMLSLLPSIVPHGSVFYLPCSAWYCLAERGLGSGGVNTDLPASVFLAAAYLGAVNP